MENKEFEVVVVGAGQAGLGISYFLKQRGRQHAVFEQKRIGESWISQRWDSFQLNTPNSFNCLPGFPYQGMDPDGFWTQAELVSYFRAYIDRFNLPVHTGVKVNSIALADEDHQRFCVKIQAGEKPDECVISRAVVIASGGQHTPKIPAYYTHLAEEITQLHTSAYRRPSDLPPGAVAVVGSGQSGVQIAEDLLDEGRKVYLCTSKVGRVPRRYRGKDMVEWMKEIQFFDVTYDSLENKSLSQQPFPQISGVGRYGHSVSLQYLASKGAVVLGRLLDVQEGSLILADNAAENVRYADDFSRRMKENVDTYLRDSGKELPPLEEDPADAPDPCAACAYSLPRLSLGEAGISTVIWATGFSGDFSWINLPILDERGHPAHYQGISPVPGLYFLGFPWLRSRKSGIICGIDEDARRISEAIAGYLSSAFNHS
jgi:putative flavoprotein involved in K+ transport